MLSKEYEVASESNAECTVEVVQELREIKAAEQFQVAVLMITLLLIILKQVQNFFMSIF